MSGSWTSRIDRIVGRDLRERARQIVDAAKAAVSEPVGDLVAEAGEPEPLARRAEQHRVVFETGMPDVGKAPRMPCEIVPPVVIAEDRPHAERRPQPCRARPPTPDRRHVLGDEAKGRDIVAEQHDDVGVQRVRGIDDVLDVRERPYSGRRHADRR